MRSDKRIKNAIQQFMQIYYNSKTDLLYLRLEPTPQSVINRRVTEDIVLDIGEGGRIVGIENLDASKQVNLEKLIPEEYLNAG